jgi:HD superfamily phosphohydrolase YqeK
MHSQQPQENPIHLHLSQQLQENPIDGKERVDDVLSHLGGSAMQHDFDKHREEEQQMEALQHPQDEDTNDSLIHSKVSTYKQ